MASVAANSIEQGTEEREHTVDSSGRLKKTLLVILIMLTFLTMIMIPSQAHADITVGDIGQNTGGGVPACANTGSGTPDWINCLPSGRWSTLVSGVNSRTEPAKGVTGLIQSMPSTVSNTARVIMPNMLLQFMQTFWNFAIGFSQFATTFDPLQQVGYGIDQAVATLINNIWNVGTLPALLLMVGIAAALIAFILHGEHHARHQMRRILGTIIMFALLLVMGGQAMADTPSDPAFGSPWWVTKTINTTINDVTVGFDLPAVNDSPEMMSYSGAQGDCRAYLYQMGRQYQNPNGESSNVTRAIDMLWQETALRSWVTMQWGSPQENGNTTPQEASNARQAYCHVLDSESNTNVTTQKDLTNASMGTSIDDKTAAWIFKPAGWIDPWNSRVNVQADDKTPPMDRGDDVYNTRMAMFWETCTANGGNIRARAGWSYLINNISDNQEAGKGAIIGNGGQWLRSAPADQAAQVQPDGINTLNSSGGFNNANGDGGQENRNVSAVCNAVLGNKMFRTQQKTVNQLSDAKNKTNGDAAWLGWLFDVPNVDNTWNEAGIAGLDPSDPGNINPISAMNTTKHFYGDAKIDTNGAAGSMIGAIVNAIVWGLFDILLILSKVMLCLMPVFLVFAIICRAIPVGESMEKAVKNWGKLTVNLSLVSFLYGIIGSISVFICRIMIMSIHAGAGTFFYQIVAGFSPVFAILVIGVFCKKVLKIGNPFSIRNVAEMVGGGMLISGLAGFGRSLAHSAFNYKMLFDHKGFGLTKNGRGPAGGSGMDTQLRSGRNGSRPGMLAEQAAAQQNAAAGVRGATVGAQGLGEGDGEGVTAAMLPTSEGVTGAMLPDNQLVSDDENLVQGPGGIKAAQRGDRAQAKLMGLDADKAWLDGRYANHWAPEALAATTAALTRHGVSEHRARSIATGVAKVKDAASAVTMPIRRQNTRQAIAQGFKTAGKVGLGVTGVAVLGSMGGTTAALIGAAALAHKGLQTKAAYGRAATVINQNRANYNSNLHQTHLAEQAAQAQAGQRAAQEAARQQNLERAREQQQENRDMARRREQATQANIARISGAWANKYTDPSSGETVGVDNQGNETYRYDPNRPVGNIPVDSESGEIPNGVRPASMTEQAAATQATAATKPLPPVEMSGRDPESTKARFNGDHAAYLSERDDYIQMAKDDGRTPTQADIDREFGQDWTNNNEGGKQ